MAMTFGVTKQPADRVPADVLVVPVFADRELGPGAEVVDAALGGGLAAFMEEAGFTGKVGETLAVPTIGQLAARGALLVGVGSRDDITAATLRRASAAAARRSARISTVATTLASAAPDGVSDEVAAGAVAEGFALGAYKFLEYKSEGEASKLRRVVLVGVTGTTVSAALERARVVSAAVTWARDMVNEPSDAKSPTEFAAASRRLLAGKGVRLTVLGEAQMKAQRMGGVLGVGQGSARPPRFLKMQYEPSGGRARGTLALVGKGVVFDSGGLSLKPPGGMELMKTDMGGAAAVVAAMSTLRAVGVRNRVIAYAPLVENMPSGTAIRPGDVLRIRNGTTVEVLNTDAEGRLILADALSLAVDDKVDAIVDLATLTGACLVALGDKVAGLMGNHQAWVDQVRAAADHVGEAVWPLPLPDEYRKLLDSDVADLRNVSTSGFGGTLTAGLFLEAFVGDVPWVHLDIAGPARALSEDGEVTKGGTGFGVRTIVELASTFDRPVPNPKKKKAATKKAATKKAATKKAATKKAATKKAARKKSARKKMVTPRGKTTSTRGRKQ